jgi:uroporphyrinogen decarboxylase
MNARERVLAVLSGRKPDRVPLDDSYWETTVARWRREGLPAEVAPRDYFGTNEITCIGGDYTMQMPERVLQEEEKLRLYWDSDGALRRDLHVDEGWTTQWLDFTIGSRSDWEQHRHYMTFNETRIPATTQAAYEQARAQGQFVCYAAHAAFHPTWMRVGMENLLVLMLDDPAFCHELFAAHAQLVIDIYEALCRRGMVFDGARLADDLGYRSAPLISPALYRELVYPYHKRLCDRFAEDGLKTILHSDGNIAPLIPHFIEAGFAALNPLEVKAGLDVRDLEDRYGRRLVWYGNMDARALAGTKDEIKREITTKLAAVADRGGYIYHSDHSVPNSVSFENYAYAIELVKQYGTYT